MDPVSPRSLNHAAFALLVPTSPQPAEGPFIPEVCSAGLNLLFRQDQSA
jgi:hypothetical protein